MVEDAEGRLWFATDRGISRFDGYAFQNFDVQAGLPENCILQLFKDSRGRIWMDALSRKLYLLDPQAGFPPYPFNEQKTFVSGFYQQDFFWSEPDQKMIFSIPSQGLVEMDEAGNRHIERGDSNNIILKNYGGTWRVSSFFSPNKQGQAPKITVLDGSNRRQFSLESASKQLIAFISFQFSNGLVAVSKVLGVPTATIQSLIFFQEGKLISETLFDHLIGQILEDSQHQFWVSLRGGQGIRRYPNADALMANADYETFLEGKQANGLHEDRAGGIWVTTLDDGVFYSPNNETQVFDRLAPGESEIISSVEAAGDSALFFSSLDGRIYQIRPSVLLAENTHFRVSKIQDLCWLGGLKTLVSLSDRQEIFLFSNGKKYQLEKTSTSSSRAAAAQDGRTLFTIWAHGFYQLDIGLGGRKAFPDPSKQVRIRTFDICQDPQLRVWAATPKGIFRLENDTLVPSCWQHPALLAGVEDLENYPPDPKNPDAPSLVAGTRGKGVLLLRGDEIHHFTTADGLLSNSIERLHVAADGTIWVATVHGLNSIGRRADGIWQIQRYTIEQGLPSNEVLDIATFAGFVWAATTAGLARLRPEKDNPFSPKPYEISSRANGQEIATAALADLSHEQKNIEISFRTLNFKMRGRINYRYRLLPDTAWTETNLTEVNFSALPPNRYFFEVQSQNESGIWSETASIRFRIHPPWWATWWFRGLLAVLAVAATVGIFRYRTRRLRREFERKNQILEYERRLLQAQMNPHFIFNCLTFIQNFISEGDKKNAMHYTAQFAQLTRTILNFSGKKHIALDEEIAALEVYLDLERQRSGQRFDFTFGIDEKLDLPNVELPPMLVQPFLENSIKHGQASQLLVKFEQVGDFLVVQIRDNGIGFSDNQKQNLQSKGISMTRQRLAIWNGRESLEDLSISSLERGGVLVVLHILMN